MLRYHIDYRRVEAFGHGQRRRGVLGIRNRYGFVVTAVSAAFELSQLLPSPNALTSAMSRSAQLSLLLAEVNTATGPNQGVRSCLYFFGAHVVIR